MSVPKVSVVIPVYNDAEYINQCMDSIINQTLKDIEIICVDDCSTDNSAELLKKYADSDERIKIYRFKTSKSALVARKKGVLESSAEYIMFSDADDFMSLDACELAYNEIKETSVDILQFSSNVINCANIDESEIRHLNDKRLKPYAEMLKGNEVLKECFINDKYSFTLWNKIFKASICKKAFLSIEDEYMPKAQDLYTYFVIAYYADSYIGWDSKPLYNYCYGRGVTGGDIFDINRFEKCCLQSKVAVALESFCADKSEISDCKKIIEKYKRNWIDFCITTWKNHLSKEDAAQGLEVLYKHWGEKEIVSLMYNKYDKEREDVALKIGSLSAKKLADKTVKTVAFYYSRYSVGGTERVMSLLMPMFVEMGYSVVLITEEQPTENDFPLHKNVKRVYIESADSKNFAKRLDSWETVVEENSIDLILYNAWGSVKLLWDLLYLKAKGVSVVVHAHSVFSYRLLSMDERFFNMTPVFALLDGVVTLSNVDRLFWGAYNPNTYYIPNPVSPELFNVSKSDFDNKAVIWIGRTTYEKNPEQPFEIMRKVKVQIPDAKMYLLGDFDDAKWKEKAHKYGLDDNIIFTGFVSNVNDYLAKSSVHLMTSSFEGFPMSLLEAKAHGIPTVMYELPHLELGTKDAGTLYVDTMDSAAAADEIIKLLEDKEYWTMFSCKANECAESFKNYDYKSAWQAVVEGITPQKAGNDISDDLVKTIVNHYKLGIKTIKGRNTAKTGTFKSQVMAAVQCAKEKGVVYTVKLFFKKIVG